MTRGCDWLVEVRCLCKPEWFGDPDFPGCECSMNGPVIVACGAPVTEEGAGWSCQAGHEFLGIEAELGPYGAEWERDQRERLEVF